MIDLICVNGKFPPDYLDFYAKHGVSTPIQDKIYTIRSVSRNSEGNYEVLLEELINPQVPIKHKILGIALKEPAWSLSRFVSLNNKEFTEEEIKEIMKKDKLLI